MRTSRDHNRLVGLLFADRDNAAQFHRKLFELTSGPTADGLLSLVGQRGVGVGGLTARFKKNQIKPKQTRRAPNIKKTDISAPCCFEHVSTFKNMPGFLALNAIQTATTTVSATEGVLNAAAGAARTSGGGTRKANSDWYQTSCYL